MITLQFFSGQDEANPNKMDYDGRMTVHEFDASKLQEYAETMDCIYGPCICIIEQPFDCVKQGRSYFEAITFERVHTDI